MPPAVKLRRFPPPWRVEELNTAFVVRDDNGQKLAYVHFEDEPGRRSAGQVAEEGRGAADRGEPGEATDLVEKGIKCDDLNGV
jgi:hypothetical protein